MRRSAAALSTSLFFAVAPGVVAGLVPWVLTGWVAGTPPYWLPLRVFGWAVLAAGVIVLVQNFVRFVVEGDGTPAPIAPTERLVVGGLYRYVRNPMYIAVVSTILGQALALSRPLLAVYAGGVWLMVAVFVRMYEEPTLARQFGSDYEEYRRAVPAWLPKPLRGRSIQRKHR